jgi:phage baseplate assembly protein W
MQEFLGFGLLRPFRRDQKADFAAAGGEQLIRSAVGQILGTVGSSDFGSLLHVLRHQKNDGILQELARVYIVDALKRWEPRVVVTAVGVAREQKDGENVLAIRLRYDVISMNVPGNKLVLSDVHQIVPG